MGGKIHLFSVYTDFGSCRRVKWIAGAIARLAGPRCHCTAEMWKLDSLMTSRTMGKMLAMDAAAADVLIVVVSSLEQRRPELMDWLASLPPTPRQDGLLIGLLGDEDDKAQELDWTAKQLIERARVNNRKFIWHWMGHHDGDASGWLAGSVEALLAFKQPVHEPIIMRNSTAVWQAA